MGALAREVDCPSYTTRIAISTSTLGRNSITNLYTLRNYCTTINVAGRRKGCRILVLSGGRSNVLSVARKAIIRSRRVSFHLRTSFYGVGSRTHYCCQMGGKS